MKFLFLTLLLLTGWRVDTMAALNVGARPADLSPILDDYYTVKNALVAGDAAAAAKAAGEMLAAINGVDMGSLTAKDHQAFMAWKDKLAFDARHISESKDVNHQREHFVSLSANLFKLAGEVRLSAQPIYEDYCPMRKAYWLSNDTAIRNPYLGSNMLTCGKVTRTIKP